MAALVTSYCESDVVVEVVSFVRVENSCDVDVESLNECDSDVGRGEFLFDALLLSVLQCCFCCCNNDDDDINAVELVQRR